ncbi:hypothetical protein K501DRAFT_267711 [Backusella circina FSU 941]|nr:hypothetical protein K501DRAFT_267711 [Backusella circina FSU 941]
MDKLYQEAIRVLRSDGVPLDKHKALECYYHRDHKEGRDRLEKEGYHLLEIEKNKSLEQLLKETEVILYTDAWKDVSMLLSEDYQGGVKTEKEAVANYKEEVQMLMKQISLLKQEKNISKIQVVQLESLKQEKTDFELKIKERDNKINLLKSERRRYHSTSIQQTQSLNSLK